MDLSVYRVGSLYNPTRTHWEEGADYNCRGGQHELRLFYRHPTPKEIADITRGPAQFAFYAEDDQIIFFSRFGSGPWSDHPFTWHRLPPDERELPDPGPGHATLFVILTSAEDGIIRGMRFLSFSESFSQALHQAIQKQATQPYDRVAYDRRLRALYSQYSTEALLKKAQWRTAGGE